jgi:hypothetical protein
MELAEMSAKGESDPRYQQLKKAIEQEEAVIEELRREFQDELTAEITRFRESFAGSATATDDGAGAAYLDDMQAPVESASAVGEEV